MLQCLILVQTQVKMRKICKSKLLVRPQVGIIFLFSKKANNQTGLEVPVMLFFNITTTVM